MQLLKPKENDTHEFRPILAEIQEQPLNPLARMTFWLTFFTVVFFLVWSIVGEVDIVITAPGKVIPEGHSKILQPLESGLVSKILVHEGDHVRKGQALVEIDPSVASSELDAARSNYYHTRLEMDRIQAGLNGGTFAQGRLGGTASAQGRLFSASQSSLNRQLESKTEELNRVKEEYKQSQAEIGKNQELLSRCNEKHVRMEQVIDIIARDEWDKNESEITTYKGNIEQLGHKLTELSHQQQQVEAEIHKIGADFEMTNLEDWSEKQKTATELNSRVRELSFKRRKQTLVSPVDGWVDTMYLHTVGGVVAPGERILSITPSNTKMVVQASVSNRDIGFIQKGMKTQLKIDTFDFQKYGMFEGKVKLVSTDSHDSESKQMAAGHEQTEKKLEQVYEVLIEPTTKSLLVEGRQQPLASGMTLTAEINIGKRKIIEFFIYPLIKYWHNGITVR